MLLRIVKACLTHAVDILYILRKRQRVVIRNVFDHKVGRRVGDKLAVHRLQAAPRLRFGGKKLIKIVLNRRKAHRVHRHACGRNEKNKYYFSAVYDKFG